MMNPHYHTVQEVMNVQKTCAVCNHIQVKGLQRQIEALKQCLEANGVVLNSEEEEEPTYEWKKYPVSKIDKVDWSLKEREVK